MTKKIVLLFITLLFVSFTGKAQVSIVNVQLTPYNVTPDAMLSAAVMNTGDMQQVEIISQLYNSNNELLFTVKSSPFNLKPGLNTSDGSRKATTADYSGGNVANYIKTTHTLSSGTFKICVQLIQIKTSEVIDQYCDEIESEFNQYLYLIYPTDNDSIETVTPLLMWNHNEPFSVLSQNEYFRIIISEINNDQSAQTAITVNTPVMAMNYLTTHTLQYPFDARPLKKGKQYAWQIQKVSNGVMIDQTEAWKFSIVEEKPVADNKYVALKKVLDAGYYTAENNKVFFKFDEEYINGKIACVIYNSKRKPVQPKAQNESVQTTDINFKQNGDNRYQINLNELDIKEGFYTLEAKNEKGELFLLKFYAK